MVSDYNSLPPFHFVEWNITKITHFFVDYDSVKKSVDDSRCAATERCDHPFSAAAVKKASVMKTSSLITAPPPDFHITSACEEKKPQTCSGVNFRTVGTDMIGCTFDSGSAWAGEQQISVLYLGSLQSLAYNLRKELAGPETLAETPCEQQKSRAGAGICGREIIGRESSVGCMCCGGLRTIGKKGNLISPPQYMLPEKTPVLSAVQENRSKWKIPLEKFGPETDTNQHFPKRHSYGRKILFSVKSQQLNTILPNIHFDS